MIVKLRSWRQRIKQHPVISAVSIGASLLGIALLVAFIGGYFFNWDWTGFSSYTPPVKDSNFQRGKTLWDWLNLIGVLAIPAVVGLGAAWYTAQQGKASEWENKDNQREAALQAYFDKMSELLLDKKLRESAEDDEVRKIARVRTLTILPRLDEVRKKSVLQFLHESGLLDKDKHIVDLKGADLSNIYLCRDDFSNTNLSGANLIGANLSYANLHLADLNHTNLSYADLSNTDLRDANLSSSSLIRADLRLAMLIHADLRLALLYGADLRGADLGYANFYNASGITVKELETQAESLQDAIMPDGSKHA